MVAAVGNLFHSGCGHRYFAPLSADSPVWHRALLSRHLEGLLDGEKEERDAKQANRPIAAQNTGDHSRYGIDSPQQRPCELAAVGRLIDKLAHLRFPQCFALERQIELTQLLAVKSPGLLTD